MVSGSDALIAFMAIVYGVYGAVSFLFAVFICTISCDHGTETRPWVPPWVPAVTRRDACAMPFYPIFYLLPAIFWPLTVAYFCLRPLGSAASICGIPLPGKKQTKTSGGGDSGTIPDLELGVVAGEDYGVPGSDEEVGSDRPGANVRSTDSPWSEIPPPYTPMSADKHLGVVV